ncbi:hypothetical protein U9M48_041573 [Paspalum notatum var. saurae]|uniref:ENTH domain-containing protein n=1 Tax=Paspalum notatum var. saurae TaxID=547442 RepID=A0AAQ3XGP1_PASNO
MSIRKALGAVKDQATIGLARVSGAVAPDLDVAIVRATSHDDAPPDERHVLDVLRLAASPANSQRACVASLARRLARTRDYVVAAKCLALLHRLAFFAAHSQSYATAVEGDAAADPRLLRELLRPATSGRRAGEPPLALLLDFRDDAHPASWDHSAFVRAYALYLYDRVRFLVSLLPPAVVVLAGAPDPALPPAAPVPLLPALRDMDSPDKLLARARQLRHLLDRVLLCRPAGAAGSSRVLLAALRPLLADASRLYADFARVLAALRDRFFDDMGYPDCVNTFETYVAAARQLDDLAAFFAWCDAAGVARQDSDVFSDVQRVDEALLGTMEQFLRERGRAARNSAAVVHDHDDARDDDGEHADMSGGVRALPAPPDQRTTHSSAEADPGRSVTANAAAADLVDLREPVATAAEQENKLALALFSAPPPATTAGAGTTMSTWVAFDDAPEQRGAEAASAWQKAAAEPGKADWELALVETASTLSRHESFLGGGMDALLLGGMYDHGAVRRQVAARAAAGGSASSVAVLPPSAPMLMLPAPDGTAQQAAWGDPFAASLAVPPPSYVQMADMERKRQLLEQEQHMWAQYRHGGMQGQPAGFNAAAVAMPVPMPMPVAYYNYNQVAGGYY